MRTLLLWVIVACCVGTHALASEYKPLPLGIGPYDESPDSVFEAHVMHRLGQARSFDQAKDIPSARSAWSEALRMGFRRPSIREFLVQALWNFAVEMDVSTWYKDFREQVPSDWPGYAERAGQALDVVARDAAKRCYSASEIEAAIFAYRKCCWEAIKPVLSIRADALVSKMWNERDFRIEPVETYRERREILDELMSKESRIKLRTLEVAAAFEQANRGTGAAMSKFLDEYGDWPEAKSHVETIRLQYTDLLWLEAKRRDNKGAYLEYLAWLDMHGLDLHKDDALRAAEFHSDGNVSDCADTARLVASMFPVESGRPTTSIQIEEEGARQISLFRKAQRRAANKSMNLRWLVVDSVEHEAELTAAGKHRAKERYRLSPELFVNDAARQNLVRAIAGDCGAKCTRRTGRFVLTLRLRECESPAVRDPRAGVPPDNIAPLSVYVILRSKSEALRYNRGQYLQLSGKVLSLEPATTFDGPGPVFLEPKLVLQRGQ